MTGQTLRVKPLIVACLAAAVVLSGIFFVTARERSTANMKKISAIQRAAMPALDLQTPQKVDTATFAMG